METPVLSRRAALTGLGALVVSLGAPVGPEGLIRAAAQGGPPPATPVPPLPTQLSSYIAIREDGRVTAFFGKIDGGQGLDVAVAQFVAEELDIAPGRVDIVMGDTARCVDQGGASNASGVAQGSVPLRNAAAEARLLLLEMAAERLGAPLATLTVADGVIAVTGAPDRRVTYGQLVAGRFLNAEMRWNGRYGNILNIEGRARAKPVSEYKVVGTPQPRRDVADKAFATFEYASDARLPGMLHARMIRPPVAGSEAEGVDEASIRDIPGARVVWNRGFVAVLAPKEWDAMRAMRALKVTWRQVPAPFPDQAAIYDHIRAAPVRTRAAPLQDGDVPAAIAGAARVVTAEYEWPFHSHSSMGPGCALADVKPDSARVWTGSQKPHAVRDGIARMLGLPQDKVHSVWMQGPGSYGRNDAGDAAFDAAFLSKQIGQPVRVQYMRDDGHAWDAKSPASVHTLRAALSADGRVLGIEHVAKGFSRTNVSTSENNPADSMAGMLMGQMQAAADTWLFPNDYVPISPYAFGARRMEWQVIAPLLERASPLRTGHLRDPVGPETVFAAESFVDELAAATGSDPVAFRLRHLSEPRDIAVLHAVAEAAGWQPRPAGPRGPQGDVVSGRGVSLSRRDGSFVATVAEVEVNRRTGHLRATRIVCAHDCGLIVNPAGLRLTIENGLVYALSRATREEVTFSREAVTSVDWEHYPILDVTDAPDRVDIVLINRPDQRPTGAGEPMVRGVGAAVANAVFDATGARLRRGPFTQERVKAALASA